MAKHRESWERKMLEEAVERQMLWRDLLQRLAEETKAEREAAELRHEIGPYIAISREAGAGGEEIARLVGETLGWPVLDKQLVEFMAERFHVDRNILSLLDETKTNWVRETLGSLLDHRLISQDAYLKHLGYVIMLAAYQGHVVIVGRGAQFLLPRDRGLCVRIVALERDRIRQICQGGQLSEQEARRLMRDVDENRKEFVRRYFHHDIDQPSVYDFVLNSSSFGYEKTAELIVAAHRLQGLK
jgi:cytidylate kinase